MIPDNTQHAPRQIRCNRVTFSRLPRVTIWVAESPQTEGAPLGVAPEGVSGKAREPSARGATAAIWKLRARLLAVRTATRDQWPSRLALHNELRYFIRSLFHGCVGAPHAGGGDLIFRQLGRISAARGV